MHMHLARLITPVLKSFVYADAITVLYCTTDTTPYGWIVDGQLYSYNVYSLPDVMSSLTSLPVPSFCV